MVQVFQEPCLDIYHALHSLETSVIIAITQRHAIAAKIRHASPLHHAMTEQLKAYYAFITAALAGLGDAPDPAHVRHLLDLHMVQVRAFAHERLIHLLVTFFFGSAFFACMVCTAVWPMWQFFALDVILIALLAFYIKHYFFLENTIQKLYPITQALFHRLDAQIPPSATGHSS